MKQLILNWLNISKVVKPILFICGFGVVSVVIASELEKLNACPDSPNCAQTQDADYKSFVEPILVIAGKDEEINWSLLKSIVMAQANTALVIEEQNYLKVEFRSKLLKFVDDVEFLLSQDRRRVDMRSASRTGYYDFNVNKKRLKNIKALYQDGLGKELPE